MVIKTYTYTIRGQVSYNDAESGFITVEIDQLFEIDEMSADAAKQRFFAENGQWEFQGLLQTCDAETGGKCWASYLDLGEGQTLDVRLAN